MISGVLAIAMAGQGHKTPATQTKQVRSVKVAVAEDVAPSSKIRLELNTQNVRSIDLTAKPIDGEKWFSTPSDKRTRPQPVSGGWHTWRLAVASKDQPVNPNQADTFYSRQINLPPMKPGIYLLDAMGGDEAAWAVVNVTNLAVVLKRSSQHALAWVTDFKSGKVVPGASVKYLTARGKVQQAVATKSDGTAFLSLPPGEGTFVVQRGHDLAGIASSQEDPNGKLLAHFETDRPSYRPGQTVSFKSILRRTQGTGYRPVLNRDCTVELRDPHDNAIDQLRVRSNGMGTVSGSFSIPSQGMTGPYTLALKEGGDTAFQTISVANYRKPEYQVEAKPLKARYLAGEEMSVEVDANYYFGAPVPQAQVRYQVRRSSMSFGGYDSVTGAFYSGDGNLYARDTYQADATVSDDTVFTDDHGKAVIKLKTDAEAGDSTYSVSLTVADASHRQVQAATSVPVYGSTIRLGLGSSLSYASLGALIPVSIHLEDWEGKPASGTVALELKRPVYDEKTGTTKELLVTSTSAKVGASGRYTIDLPARAEGELRIYAKCSDGTGRFARAVLGLYVSGNYEPPEKVEEQPKVDVRLDKQTYEPGESAKALIETNHSKLPILAVLEGGDIWDYQVLPAGSRARTWKVSTNLKLSPNAYVTAAQWVKGEIVSGNVALPVPDRSKALRVTLGPDRTSYAPGDPATYRVHAEDAHGKPVSAEVSVGVVDEAIYALGEDQTEDVYRFYWGLRGDAVTMQTSAPQELSGGAYQRVNALAPVRQRFEDTAFWSPTVTTDRNGDATVKFDMPGNLTTWRATARAVTLDTAVGGGISKVVATRPVTLRLSTPRQMVVGDVLTLQGTVNNRSNSDHVFDIRLDASGIAISGSHSQQVSVKAKSEGHVRWTIKAVSMPEDGAASLSAQVEAHDQATAEFADALRVSLPISPNGLPYRSVVGGSLAQTGEAKFDLPGDRIEPASTVKVTVWLGLRPLLQTAASAVLDQNAYDGGGSDDQLEVAAFTGLPSQNEHVREALAYLAGSENGQGFGWWIGAPPDPVLTARTLAVLSECRTHGIRVYDRLFNSAIEAAVARYEQDNLWEDRALLASAVAMSGDKRGPDLLAEVESHGKSISPYGWLKLAGGALKIGHREEAEKLAESAIANADAGPDQSYLPAGEGTGWTATDIQATAELLAVLSELNEKDELQQKLARWLAGPDQAWRSLNENAAVARAASLYLQRHREDEKLGRVSLVVNGTRVELKKSTVDPSASATVPVSVLKNGSNTVGLSKDSGGEAFFTVDVQYYHPNVAESTMGIRVLRRFEVKNSGGSWVELRRPVRTGEPVRCTVLAWGDNRSDALVVSEPIPAGFEYVEDGGWQGASQEVEDGAVVDRVANPGTPVTFSYYLRSESAGKLNALPATATYIRRPRLRGNTGIQLFEVVEP